MKKITRLFLIVMASCMFFSTIAFAGSREEEDRALNNISFDKKSVLLPEGVNKSTGYSDGSARGSYMSSAYISITNEGYGSIGIYGRVLAHFPVKKIRMVIYLDVWDETKEEWHKVDTYDFEKVYEEGGEDLTSLTESFSVIGLPTNCYYRLRGACGVYPFTGGFENQGPVTDGIKITDGPAYTE